MAADEDDIGALYDSMVEVLSEECGSIDLHKYYSGELSLDERLWARAAELGWTAIGLPEEHGGLAMGLPGLVALFRALGRFGVPDLFLTTIPAAQWLSEYGSAELCSRILPAVITGETMLAVPAAPSGRVLQYSQGLVSGVSSALIGSPKASVAILPTSAGLALVEIGNPEVAVSPSEMWDRTRPMMTVTCEGAQPVEVIDDPDGEVARTLFRTLSLAIAADSIGGGRRMAEQTIEYLKAREQFGKPLASFQALKHRVANLLFALEAADEHLNQGLEAAQAGDVQAGMWVALAKVAASEAYKFVTEDSLQLHGGVGYTWEFDCHIFLKRALLNQTLAGDNNLHRDVAASALRSASVAGISTAELAA